jgi:hypothetical protein
MAAALGTEMKRTLTMTGLTINAMALIAPGAFLWTTFQAQVVQQNGGRPRPSTWSRACCSFWCLPS